MILRTSISSIRRLRRILRRVALLGLAFLGVFLLATPFVYRYLTDEERIRRAAQAFLQRYTTGKVEVTSASFSWRDGIRLQGVSLFPNGDEAGKDSSTTGRTLSASIVMEEDERSTHCTCSEVLIAPDFRRILFGQWGLDSITAVRPRCTIVRDEGRTTHLTGLMRRGGTEELPESSAFLPRVELREAKVQVIDRSSGRNRVVDDITLDVRGRTNDTNPFLYDVVWQRDSSTTARGHSQIDLPAGRFRNVEGGLPWMSLEAVMIAVNAQLGESGSWHELLGIEGNVRASDYELGSAPDDPRSATIELVDASLSMPADVFEEALPPDQRYLRFDHVRGVLTVSGNEAQARFQALFHGSECDVKATFVGVRGQLRSLDDVDVEIELTLREAQLPTLDARLSETQARFLDRWPPIGDFICSYEPHGMIDLDIHATKKAGAGEPFEIEHLLLTAHGGDASIRWFPYRVYGITGTIEMNPMGVFVPRLRGTRSGGEIEMSAWLSDSTRCAEGIMLVKAKDLPVDDELLAALPGDYERICREFNLSGEFTAELTLTRELCEDPSEPKEWRGTTRLELARASATYVDLPYPVHDVSGRLTIERGVLHLDELRGRVGRGAIVLNGRAPAGGDSGEGLDLNFQASGIAVDETLLAALPDSVRERLADLRLDGDLGVDAHVFRDAESGRPTYKAALTVGGRGLRLPGVPLTLEDVEGRLTVTPLTLALEDLSASFSEARIQMQGHWAYGLPDGPVELDLRATGVRPNAEVVDSLPEGVRQSLGGWQTDGPLDISAHLVRERGQSSVRPTRVVVALRDATVTHPRLPIPLEDVSGVIQYMPGLMTAEDLTARWGSASVRAGLRVQSAGELTEGEIELHAADLELGPAWLAVLSDSGPESWRRSGPTGVADLHLDRVHFRRDSGGGPWEGEFQARLDLAGAAFPVGLEDAYGEIRLAGSLGEALTHSAVTGDIRLERARLFQQPVENLRGDLSLIPSEGGRWRLDFGGVEASLHEGRVSGQGFVDLAGSGSTFGASVALREVQIGPVIRSLPREGVLSDKPSNVNGRLFARAHLSGAFENPQSIRGGGSVEVRDGYLYRLPIILAILQVINLAPPQDDVFDRASADFYVVGRNMQLANVELRSKVLMLTGSGELSLPDQGLDLNLVHTNPNRWTRLPMVSDLMEGASREFLELHVTGPLSRPTVRARALPRLVDELGELFRRRDPPITRSAGS